MKHFLSNLTALQKPLLILTFFFLILGFGVGLYFWQVKKPENQLVRAIKDYESVNKNLKDTLPEQSILGRTQEGLKWVSVLEKTRENLSSGKKEEAKNELQSLKSRIEFISEANEAKGYNLDKNKDGISDYAEELYQEILAILKKL